LGIGKEMKVESERREWVGKDAKEKEGMGRGRRVRRGSGRGREGTTWIFVQEPPSSWLRHCL